MQEYCGINLTTKKFYVGSTTDIHRRLKGHEKNQRLGEGQIFWLIGQEHEDETREEEQFYLDFYFRSPKCLNLSGNSKLGDGRGRIVSEKTRQRLGQSLLGNVNGKENKGMLFFYDPETKETSRFAPGTEPNGWKPGNPKNTHSGYSYWKNSEGKKVRVYPGDDTTGLTPPALKRRDRQGEAYNASRRKEF